MNKYQYAAALEEIGVMQEQHRTSGLDRITLDKLKSLLQDVEEYEKKSYQDETVTSFSTAEENNAYEKGREYERGVMLKFVENYDGHTSSIMGSVLSKTINRLNGPAI